MLSTSRWDLMLARVWVSILSSRSMGRVGSALAGLNISTDQGLVDTRVCVSEAKRPVRDMTNLDY